MNTWIESLSDDEDPTYMPQTTNTTQAKVKVSRIHTSSGPGDFFWAELE